MLHYVIVQSYESSDGYTYKEARTRQEAKQLIEEGFENVMGKDDASLFRKLVIANVGTRY